MNWLMNMEVPNERGEVGRYDEVTERLLKECQASCVAALIFNGKNGSGFSVATTDMALMKRLPDMLEHMATNIRAQLKAAASS
jgi:hypothetical protein